MDFEIVVGLLVFAFYVLPMILKKVLGKKSAAKPSAGPPKEQGLAARFAEKAQRVIKELEKQAAEAKKNKTPTPEDGNLWDHLVASKDGEEQAFDYFEPVDEPEKPVPVAPAKAAESNKPIKAVAPVKLLKRKAPAPPVPAAEQTLPTTVTKAMTPRGLRNAVVWSEILSPPLALRDDG